MQHGEVSQAFDWILGYLCCVDRIYLHPNFERDLLVVGPARCYTECRTADECYIRSSHTTVYHRTSRSVASRKAHSTRWCTGLCYVVQELFFFVIKKGTWQIKPCKEFSKSQLAAQLTMFICSFIQHRTKICMTLWIFWVTYGSFCSYFLINEIRDTSKCKYKINKHEGKCSRCDLCQGDSQYW